VSSLWLILVAAATFSVAYRFYGAFLGARVAMLSNANATPAHRLRDGVDYHPTNKWVLFGHHFAAIAGPGPLIGPVLAAQWGYLPGFTWIIIGACLAGGVHDFITLWASVRQNGRSLPMIARENIGPVAGLITSITTLFIIITILASVAIVVVNALSESSWGMFTIIVTIPAAVLTGLWMYKIRPGHLVEASAIGVTIVMLGVILGQPFAHSQFAHYLVFSKPALSIILPSYAFVASVLPVWVLMCPRDYLSCYMKIGVIVLLAAGLIFVHPTLQMPATTPFLNGGGPIITGAVWPFVCIVIMCGALSGFHALIASGTTPKMISRERDILPIGYGAMLVEGMVAVTALIAACALQPGDYFKINIAQDKPAQVATYTKFVGDQAARGWDVAPREFAVLEAETGEKLAGRTGGAVTLAVGMAKVFANLPGMRTLMAYWYHFVIMFEALFILTLLETGTRVARFVFHECVAQFKNELEPKGHASWPLNISLSFATCFAWGYLLYTGNINTLWRMLGISNQLLALIALAIGTTYLLNHATRRGYALITFIPFVFALVTVYVASYQSVTGWWAAIIKAPTATEAFSLRLMAILGGIMMVLTGLITLDSARRWYCILSGSASPIPTNLAGATVPVERD
jgi:carbon starvation protein